MAAMFSSPKMPSPPDTSAADAEAARARKEADDQKKKIQEELGAKRRAIRGGQQGRFSLLGPNGETGVTDATLG
jgi:hypothetical protein